MCPYIVKLIGTCLLLTFFVKLLIFGIHWNLSVKEKKWLISHWQLYVLRRIDYICALVGIWLNNILNFVNTYSGWCWQLASLDFLLLREARLRFGSNFNFLHFQLGRQTGLPQQPNDFDCGYYTLKYMDNPSIVADQSYQVYAFFFQSWTLMILIFSSWSMLSSDHLSVIMFNDSVFRLITMITEEYCKEVINIKVFFMKSTFKA